MEDTGEILSQLSSSVKCDILNYTGASIFTTNNISFKTIRHWRNRGHHSGPRPSIIPSRLTSYFIAACRQEIRPRLFGWWSGEKSTTLNAAEAVFWKNKSRTPAKRPVLAYIWCFYQKEFDTFRFSSGSIFISLNLWTHTQASTGPTWSGIPNHQTATAQTARNKQTGF